MQAVSKQIFDLQSSSVEENCTAGEKILVNLYNEKPEESLNSLWYKQFCEKVASNTSHINPRSLPRTAAAAKCHSLHVFLQIHQWKGSTEKLNPEQLGWKKVKVDLSLCRLIYLQHQMNSCV